MDTQSQIERNTEEETSPNHEFSFTISLHSPSKAPGRDKTIDFSPADKIFFRGHLLPQHYLSSLPVFPSTSTDDSFDSFMLPVDELSDQEYISIDHMNPTCQESCSSVLQEEGVRRKPRPFSSLRISKWRKSCHDEKHEKCSQQTDQKQQRKPKFNLSYIVRKYMRFIAPLLPARNKGMNPQAHGHSSYSSFLGNLQVRNNKELRGMRGEFSAPASMRNSPTNSGHLVASGTATPTARDGTMEELQAAIQSAIAHCKKSIAAEETIHVK